MNNTGWKVSEVVGSEIWSVSGEKLGVLIDVLPTGANDVWVVRTPQGEKGEILIPALRSVVKDVDLQNKKIIVDLPQGLKEIYEG